MLQQVTLAGHFCSLRLLDYSPNNYLCPTFQMKPPLSSTHLIA